MQMVYKYPYLVYYALMSDEVSILHIRHGSRANPGSIGP
jgi:plasmid stabilization system protein ParE